jgi:iron complex outermembrane receptor protein
LGKRLELMLGAVMVSAMLPVSSAWAQDAAGEITDSNEILVSARRKQESILKVPAVASVVTAEDIEKAQITNLSGISTKVPGLFVSPAIATIGNLISLRGVGTSALDPGVDQSVSLNIDGQQFSQGLAFRSGLFDLAQAEVLKGPQALFFGKNSPAGVIALTTADPSNRFEMIGRLSYEIEAREPRVEMILSGPASDTLGLRLAGTWSDAQGYFRNVAGRTALPSLGGLPPSKTRADSNENYIIRGTAVWKPSSNFRARLKLNITRDHSDAPNGNQNYSCPSGTGPSILGINFIGDSRNCAIDDEVAIVDLSPAGFPGIENEGRPFLTLKQRYGVLQLDYDFAKDLSATSTTTYYRNRTTALVNGTYAAAAPVISAYNQFYRRDFTQEIRFASDYNDSPLNWMLGAYYQSGRMKNDITIRFNTLLNPALADFTRNLLGSPIQFPAILSQGSHDVSIDAKSLFGQIRWKPASQLEIAGGARWTREKRGNRPTSFGVAIPIPKPELLSKNWSPELTVTYTPTDDLTIFGALKQGYKSGSYQILTPYMPGEERSFGDEKVQGGEAGIKARLLDRALSVNAAFYYYQFKGLQIGDTQASESGIPVTRTLNAGKSRTYGIDFDASYRPPAIDGLSLSLAVNWNKAQFLELNGLPCYGGQTIAEGCNQALNPRTGLFTARDESGTPLERAPEWQIVGGFEHEASVTDAIDLLFGSSVQFSSSWRSPIGSRADFTQPSFTKLNAHIGLKDTKDRWEVSLIGNNVTDRLTGGYCSNSDFVNSSVLTGFAVVTGAASNPTGKIDEAACIANRGREVWLKLTFRPFALFQ